MDLPTYLEERILAYLKTHEDQHEVRDFVGTKPRPAISRTDIQAILESVLLRVEKEVLCREKYDRLYKCHHQYPLFELQQYIPDFRVDEKLLKRMAFRETLIISQLTPVGRKFDRENLEPTPIGGLCLNIELTPAKVAKEQFKSPCDEQLLDLCHKLSAALSLEECSEEKQALDAILEEKLQQYEEYIQMEMEKKQEKFVVHLSSQFDVGMRAGSRITAWVDHNFHSLEEKRTEFFYEVTDTKEEILNEKSLYFGMEKRKYYVRHASSKEKFEERKHYSLARAQNLVGEGANFILMRYLAITEYKGSFELSTMYINGDMCRNLYECDGRSTVRHHGHHLDVCKIYRVVIEECGVEHRCVTYLTPSGRIVSQEWEGCDCILNINPLVKVVNGLVMPSQKCNLRHTYKDDLQLFSRYLDSKANAQCEMKAYLTDHPEVMNMISDFLQNILLMKPENILMFTQDYFKNFQPYSLGRQVYLDDADEEETDG